MPDWRSFLNQRIRWASKSYDYPEWRVTFRLAMVFIFLLVYITLSIVNSILWLAGFFLLLEECFW